MNWDKRILIVDDDTTCRVLLEAHLSPWGYQVTPCAHGQDAWDLMQQPDPPRLLIIDWMMPEIDGLELCRRIRALKRLRYIYIIILTAKNQREDIVKGFDVGADDFIIKPFYVDELRSRLNTGQRILDYEEMLVETRERMAAAEYLAGLGVTTAGIAHEINQPLNALKITADGLIYQMQQGMDIDPLSLRTKLQRISDQVTRIDRIVTHMRTLAKPATAPSLSAVSPSQALKNALSLLGNQLANHHITLTTNFGADTDVKANPIQLEQVMINLIVNAMQALDTVKTESKTITIVTRRIAGQVQLTLSDNGPGLPQDGDRLFYQLHTNASPHLIKMGIGLKIVRNLITSWGGTIEARNRDPGGAEFIITLHPAGTE